MDATTEVHTQEENQGSRRAVGRARVTPDGCKLGMASRHHVSLALEEEIEHNQEKRVYAPPQLPEKLHRRAALEQDAAFWYGPAGRSASRIRRQERIPYAQATQLSVRRPQELELLVAHAYTRYLGDPSGVPCPQKDRSEGPGPVQLRRAWPLHFPQHDQRHGVQAASCMAPA